MRTITCVIIQCACAVQLLVKHVADVGRCLKETEKDVAPVCHLMNGQNIFLPVTVRIKNEFNVLFIHSQHIQSIEGMSSQHCIVSLHK